MTNSSGPSAIADAVREQTETYVKPAALPMYGLRGLAAQIGSSA
jgi:hypothetical protein